jgi:hypothetical protein
VERYGEALPDLADPKGRAWLDEIIEDNKLDVIVLDSLSTLFRSGMVENDADNWAPIQAWMQGHRMRGRTVILLVHENRTGQARGTSKREDIIEALVRLKECADKSTEDESVFELSFPKARNTTDKKPLRLIASNSENGLVEWEWEPAEDNFSRVKAGLEAGKTQSQIAKELGVSKGLVSMLAKRARGAGAMEAETIDAGEGED